MKCFGDERDKAGADGWIRYGSEPKTYELIFFLAGGGDCVYDSVRLRDAPGSIRFLPKGRIQGEYLARPETPISCIDVFFDTDDPMPAKAAVFPNMDRLREDFTRLLAAWSKSRNSRYAESMSLFYKIIRDFQLSCPSYAPASRRGALQPALEYLKANCCSRHFDYAALCARSGLSRSAFNENFRKVCGVPPVRMVTRLRVERACEMLATGHYTVTETAEACGFENVYYFSNVFKKETGVSPGAYRP